jgi:HK97 family phage major capsid protein
MTISELIAQKRAAIAAKLTERAALVTELAQLRDKAEVTAADEARVSELRTLKDRIDSELRGLEVKIAEYEAEDAADRAVDALAEVRTPGAPSPNERKTSTTEPRWVRSNDGRPATVARGQSFGNHEIVREHAARQSAVEASIMGQHGSIGQLVRSMSTTSGSALVPTVWASDIIDRARNFAAVLQAGAEIVPMDAKVVQIGRLTADPTAAFRTEGSTITASDPTFDNVTLTATTQSALVVGSLEWFQDASNVDEVVSNAIAKAIGLNLDLVSLYGSITAGAGSINLPTPPNPRGVLGALNATAATSVLPSSGAATNGTTQTSGSFWNELLDLLYTPQDYNEHPNALIWNSKAARKYAKAYDTTGQPLRRPSDFDDVELYVSNQIPSYTQGTMSNVATDVFLGDFTQLLIGQRLDLHIQTLTERYAELGQVGIVANWRGDVGVARPRAFSVFKAIQGA